MLEQGGGAVVNISSAMGRLTDRGFVAYGTAKGALSHITRLVARRPGAQDPGQRASRSGPWPPRRSRSCSPTTSCATRWSTTRPLKRLGEPEDIALAALTWLAGGRFVTGKVFEVDGGIESPNLDLGLPDL